MGKKDVRVSAKTKKAVASSSLVNTSLSFSVDSHSLPVFIQPDEKVIAAPSMSSSSSSSSSSDLVLDCVKDVSILYDKNRKQFSLKLPKELVEIYRIKKHDKLRMRIKIREGQPIEGTFGVISK